MALSLLIRRQTRQKKPPLFPRHLRSDAALEAILKAAEEKKPPQVLALYNYPSFSGAFSALFAHLFHSRLRIPFLILPFSSVVPLRVDDICLHGLKTCYLLDFVGPRGFATELCRRTACEVICFDHRKSALKNLPSAEDCSEKVTFHVDVEKSSSRAVYEYFSRKLTSAGENSVADGLLNAKDQEHVELMLKYLADGDLRHWKFPDIRAFNVGMSEGRSQLNCINNPHMYDQLLELRVEELIAKGNSHMSARKDAAKKYVDKTFKLWLGQGLYGECLGVRADGSSDLCDEIGKELSLRSAAAGLRPIGAVVFMQRNNLKMCLRSTDGTTDTSEISKVYGGGGTPSSSSFIIRMDEFNQWLRVNSTVHT